MRFYFCFVTIILLSSFACGQYHNKIDVYKYSGTAEEMAKEFGKDKGKQFNRFFDEVIKVNRLDKPGVQTLMLMRVKKMIASLDEEARTELNAFAKTSGVDVNKLMLANTFYELSTYGCRQVVAWGDKTQNQEFLHARNLDWYDWGVALRSNNVFLVRHYNTGNAVATFTWPGFLGCLTGCNDKGLTIAFNQLRGAWNLEGEPIFFVLKRALRQAQTIDQAVKIIKESNLCTSGSVGISSYHEKNAVVVDIVEGDVMVRPAEKNFIVNNNTCYFNVRGKFSEEGYRNCSPYKVVDQVNDIDVDKMTTIMGDDGILLGVNLLTAVFVPGKNRVYVSCGKYKAAHGPYLSIPVFLPKSKAKEEKAKKEKKEKK